MINFVATATLAISLMAAAPKAPQWEQSYGKALEATRAGQDPLLVVLDKPDSKDARLEPALLSEDKASGDNSKLLEPLPVVPRRCDDRLRPKGGQGLPCQGFPACGHHRQDRVGGDFPQDGPDQAGRVEEDPDSEQVRRAVVACVARDAQAVGRSVRPSRIAQIASDSSSSPWAAAVTAADC